MNGLSIYQLQVSSQYTAADFDDDLRHVLRRAGCKGEKICFIMDESNVLDSGFLERMNTLLANAEIPGLFDGDEYTALMTACREGSQRDGLILDSNDELYRWFTRQIASNLHVVFTMNPPAQGLQDRIATSPALFNRCVLDWFGDWSATALNQVATELIAGLDLEKGESYVTSATDGSEQRSSYSQAIVTTMVHTHQFVLKMIQDIAADTFRKHHVTPRHFLDL
jgi:dynein heavy chain 1